MNTVQDVIIDISGLVIARYENRCRL